MENFSSAPGFAHLSLADLLRARDQFHPHLVHKRNVVGTAVGRYLIRKGDPPPGGDDGEEAAAPRSKPPRTIEESEVRDYSWPCVLVFVSEWIDDDDFGSIGEIPASDYIPKTIYLEDGKAVPVCVVLAPRIATAPPRRPTIPSAQSKGLLQGGARVESSTQGVTHPATIGCLFTDGHKVYALTSRHVAGALGEELKTDNGITVGTTSALQLGRVPFESVYAPWSGKHTYVNLDVALVEVNDLRIWSSGIQSIGAIGPLAALSTYNLSLDLIGCPVRAYGAASGLLEGRVAALFYRYKSVGGFDYVADFLIGSRSDEALRTSPGDSGMVWVVDAGDDTARPMPIAVQWGGTVLGSEEQSSTFALASNLSTIARELNVDVYRGPSVAAFEYWGARGHSRIGEYACGLVTNPTWRALLEENLTNIGWLANVPDTAWKSNRGGNENPGHYSDMDYRPAGGRSLDDLTPDAAHLSAGTWRDYYDSIDWVKTSERGLLPFRIWQVYKDLVALIANGRFPEAVAAAGVLAHYKGDAAQPLHSSLLDNGDRFRFPGGGTSDRMIARNKPYYGKGVHSKYETKMLDDNTEDLEIDLEAAMPDSHGMDLVDTPRQAAWASIELMRRARRRLPPVDIVETYARALRNHQNATKKLWSAYRRETVNTLVDGARTLAMLWDSAWVAGGGPAQQVQIQFYSPQTLRGIIDDPDFLPSIPLNQIDPFIED